MARIMSSVGTWPSRAGDRSDLDDKTSFQIEPRIQVAGMLQLGTQDYVVDCLPWNRASDHVQTFRDVLGERDIFLALLGGDERGSGRVVMNRVAEPFDHQGDLLTERARGKRSQSFD